MERSVIYGSPCMDFPSAMVSLEGDFKNLSVWIISLILIISLLLLGISIPRDDFPGVLWILTACAPKARDRSSERLTTWLTFICGWG